MKTIKTILFLFIVIHLSICLALIFFTKFLDHSRISRFYKVYLMPGPFFSESKVVNSYHMLVSWKREGQWTTPINHAHQSFANYQSTFNPIDLNRNRLERSLYEAIVRRSSKHKHVFQSKEWENLVRYTKTKMIPVGSDSMKITLLVETPTTKDSVLLSNTVKCLWDGAAR